jgi:hypothetical protein
MDNLMVLAMLGLRAVLPPASQPANDNCPAEDRIVDTIRRTYEAIGVPFSGDDGVALRREVALVVARAENEAAS